MDAASDTDHVYSREAYTHRYRDRLRHQKDKLQETTKVWVLALPQNRLDLRCHSIHSVKVDEFFHSSLYFQWCVRRFKKSLGASFPADSADWATLVYQYMMAESEREPFEVYNLTDQQILVDGREVFGAFDEALALPVTKPSGMLEFGKATHRPGEGDPSNGMNCWAHRINRDADTVFETCRNEGYVFSSLPKSVCGSDCVSERRMHAELEGQAPTGDDPIGEAQLPTKYLSEEDSTAAADGACGGASPLVHRIDILSDVRSVEMQKNMDMKVAVEEERNEEDCSTASGAMAAAGEMGQACKEEESKMMPSPGAKNTMSYKDACEAISEAISQGAPTYNKGDHKGCYEVYKAAAEKILEQCSIGGVQKELRSALEQAAKQQTFTKQAWSMRHAFDDILCGDIDTEDLSESELESIDPPLGKAAMTYKQACSHISAAISKGAPTYNLGDHKGCYEIYKKTAEKIVERCGIFVVQLELRSALGLAEKESNFTDRAWTMRHAFDTILHGTFGSGESSMGELLSRLRGASGSDAAAAADEKDSEMSYEDVCREISSAISKGAPVYNQGDHSGCYNIYKDAAEKIVEKCSVESVKRELRTALENVEKQSSSTMRAWTIRHAFDTILRGRGRSQFGDDNDLGGSVRLSADDPSIALFSHLLGRRGTL